MKKPTFSAEMVLTILHYAITEKQLYGNKRKLEEGIEEVPRQTKKQAEEKIRSAKERREKKNAKRLLTWK